jgi:hypothetical protein
MAFTCSFSFVSCAHSVHGVELASDASLSHTQNE